MLDLFAFRVHTALHVLALAFGDSQLLGEDGDLLFCCKAGLGLSRLNLRESFRVRVRRLLRTLEPRHQVVRLLAKRGDLFFQLFLERDALEPSILHRSVRGASHVKQLLLFA